MKVIHFQDQEISIMPRYCCSREEFDTELQSLKKSLSHREHFENTVIKHRFRYEDGALPPLQAKVGQSVLTVKLF